MNKILYVGKRVSFDGCRRLHECASCGYSCFSAPFAIVKQQSSDKKIQGTIVGPGSSYDYLVEVKDKCLTSHVYYIGVDEIRITIESKLAKHKEALNAG